MQRSGGKQTKFYLFLPGKGKKIRPEPGKHLRIADTRTPRHSVRLLSSRSLFLWHFGVPWRVRSSGRVPEKDVPQLCVDVPLLCGSTSALPRGTVPPRYHGNPRRGKASLLLLLPRPSQCLFGVLPRGCVSNSPRKFPQGGVIGLRRMEQLH